MEESEALSLAKQEVKTLDNYLDPIDYENALSDAIRETGWTFPVTSDFRAYWMKMRMKRHLFFYLASESARKFKVKQFSLDQRFKHYMILIKDMDEKYNEAMEMHPEEFTNAQVFSLFGTKIDAGFAYDELGNDITYDRDQRVILTPGSD
jgi:hypothetical protein